MLYNIYNLTIKKISEVTLKITPPINYSKSLFHTI